jgi:hypothetical protein
VKFKIYTGRLAKSGREARTIRPLYREGPSLLKVHLQELQLNSPEMLKETRTKYRVPQHPNGKHPLIRALRAELGIPIYYHSRRFGTLKTGTAPNRAFYEARALYVNIKESAPNLLIHELCHALVARKFGTLDETNYGLQNKFSRDDKEEIDTCMIEFCLGLMSGYYSWEELGYYIHEYSFDDMLSYDDDSEWNGYGSGLASYYKVTIIDFIVRCRDVALGYPGVREVCNRLCISMSERAIIAKVTKHWRVQ